MSGARVAVALAAAIAFLPFLGQGDTWGTHETRHGEIARELTAKGDWFIPPLCGRVYADKPPVFHWLVAACYAAAGGPGMTAARLPSALAAIAACLGVQAIGERLASRRAGLLAGLFLAATPGHAIMARTARPDMVFCALVLAACLAATPGTGAAPVEAPAPGGRRGAAAHALGFGIAMGLAVLVKGPLGLGIPLVFALALRRVGGRRPLRGATGVVLAATGLAAVLAAYAVPLAVRPEGRAYLAALLTHPDLTSGARSHARPFYYYLGRFPTAFAPFVPFLALAVRDVVGGGRKAASAALIATLASLAILSAIPGKRIHYLLVVHPFAALAAAEAVDRRLDGDGARRLRALAGALVGLSIAGSLAWYGGGAARLQGPSHLRAFGERAAALLPPGAPVLSHNGVGEVVAFLGRRDVLEVDVRGAASWLAARPGTGYVALRAETRAELESYVGRRLDVVHEEREPDGRPPPPPDHYILLKDPGPGPPP